MIAYALGLAALTALFIAPRLGRRVGLLAALGLAIDLMTVPGPATFETSLSPLFALHSPDWVGHALTAALAVLAVGILAGLATRSHRCGPFTARWSMRLLTVAVIALSAVAAGQSAALASDWLFGFTLLT